MKKVIAGLLGAGLVLGMAPAFAGDWRLDSRRCTTLVETRYDDRDNRRDQRYDSRSNRGDQRYDSRSNRGDQRYDSRSNRGDQRYGGRDNRRERITVCSRSAFYYVPDRRERSYNRHRAHRLSLSYDSRPRMYFRFDRGRKIYVRG